MRQVGRIELETASFPGSGWAALPVNRSILRLVTLFCFDGVGEVVGRIGAPVHLAIAQGDVVGVLDGEAGVSCGSMGAMAVVGRLSKSPPLILGPAVEGDGDVVEQ